MILLFTTMINLFVLQDFIQNERAKNEYLRDTHFELETQLYYQGKLDMLRELEKFANPPP